MYSKKTHFTYREVTGAPKAIAPNEFSNAPAE